MITVQNLSFSYAGAPAPALRAIDFAIACGTAGKIDVRPRRADALSMMIAPWLRTETPRASIVNARRAQMEEPEETTALLGWTWTPLRHPGTFNGVIRDVAWDSDGDRKSVV